MAPEIARLVPALRRTLPDIPPPDDLPAEQQQRYFFNAMLEFTARLAEACPLVILLDDMQWADDSSAGLLEHVAPQLPRLPILMVATYRDVATDLREPFKHALARLSHQDYATRIRLKPLGNSAVSEMLTSLSGQPAPEAVAELIFEETGGNAFFAKSLFQHLAEEGVLFDEQGRWLTDIDRDALSVPEGVRLVIERRLARLDEQTVAVLSAGALEGLRFDQRVLEIALGEALAGSDALDPEAVLEAVEQAATAGLIFAIGGQRETRFEFAHALVRQALLEALSSGRRQRQHWRLGQALEQLYGEDREHASDIAHHYYRAGSQADAQRTVRFLVLAGQRALDTAAADEAAVAFTRALEFETDELARAELLYRRGMAYRTSGNIDRGFDDWLAALPAFETQPNPERVAEICWAMAYGLSWKNEMQAAEALARRGLAVVGEAPGIARCRLLGVLGMCVGNRDSFELWEKHSREAVEMARELDDDRLRTEVLMGRQYLGEHYFEGALAMEAAEEAVPCARCLNEPWELCSTLGVMMVGCFKTLNLDLVDASWEECLQLARKYGDYGNEMHAMVIRGSLQAMRGHLDEGFALVDNRARWAREVNFAWKNIMIEMSANVEFMRGNWDQARSMYTEIMAEPIVSTMSGVEAAAQALFFAYADDPGLDEAIEAIKPRAAVAGRKNQIGAWFTAIALLEIYAMRGQREACAALYDIPVQLEAVGTRSVWLKGLSTTFAGIAAAAGGHWDLAEQHFNTSEATANALGLALPAAELLRWQAQMLLWRDAGSDRVHARELLAQAAAAYRQLGMRRHVQLVESLAVQAMGKAAGPAPVSG